MKAPSSADLSSRRRMLRQLAAGLAAVATGFPGNESRAHEPASQEGVKVTKLLNEELSGHPEETVTLVLLEFSPKASSPPHRHSGPVFIYVTAGTVETQIGGGPLTTLHAGEVFYEPAGAVHLVARNPSATESAKAVAFMIGGKGAPLTNPA
ncbi:MAG: cupin protein [Chthoniobacteraceae bacterium]|nr:cupin protein [Chthoniobacteraceae bacterium]